MVIMNNIETIETFLKRYAKNLTDGNFDAIAKMYNYPALAITARGCQAIENEEQTRNFFKQGREFYFSRGITAIDITDVKEDASVPGIWVGRALLVNLNDKGERVGVEHNAYQIVALENGEWRIAVTTPMDAYNSEQQSGVK